MKSPEKKISECVQAVNDACEQLQLRQIICQKFK